MRFVSAFLLLLVPDFSTAASVAFKGVEASAACVHGQEINLDLHTLPVKYLIEIRYSVNSVYLPLPTNSTITGDPLQSQTGAKLAFECGDFAEYPSGPSLDGQRVGPAIGYRVTWMMIF